MRIKISGRINKKLNDTRQFELVFIRENEKNEIYDKIKNELEDDASDFFLVNCVKFETKHKNDRREDRNLGKLKYKENFNGKKIEINFIFYETNKQKCFRCFQYNVNQEGELCSKCDSYLKRHQLKLENDKN